MNIWRANTPGSECKDPAAGAEQVFLRKLQFWFVCFFLFFGHAEKQVRSGSLTKEQTHVPYIRNTES